MPDKVQKKRGRPPLSPEEKLKSLERKRERDKGYKRANGYADQKRYRMAHKSERYEVKVVMPSRNRDDFSAFVKSQNTTISKLFLDAISKVYGKDFSK